MKWIKLVERESDFWKNYMMLISLLELQRIFGFSMNLHLTSRQGLNFTHWMHKQALREFGQELEQRIGEEAFIQQWIKIFNDSKSALMSVSLSLKQAGLTSLSNYELLELFQKYCDSYIFLYPAFHISVYTNYIEQLIKPWISNPQGAPKSIQKKIDFINKAAKMRLDARITFIKSHELSEPIFQEIGKRYGYSEAEIKWLTVPEIVRLVRKHIYPHKRVESRKEAAVLIFDHGKLRIEHGTQAKQTITRELETKLRINKIIKGQVAYSGKISGRVKIIKTVNDLAKMKRGDILVARMTTPDILLATKKAAAIITDEGGLTCHAAVVARELKIPCIIGAKFATKLLRDNDLVIVDAIHGVVNKI